jgi:hypothetical protein
MVIGTVVAFLLLGGLAVGWISHAQERNKRSIVARLASKYDKRSVDPAGSPGAFTPTRSPDSIPPSAPAKVTVPPAAEVSAGVSLSDMAKPDSLPASASPIIALADVSPEVLSLCVRVVSQYRQAKTWQEKLPFVKDPNRVEPLMQDFYEGQKMTDPDSGKLNGSQRFRFHGVEVITLFYDSSRSTGRVDVALMQDASGQWQLDWESYVGYSELGWTRFKQERPTTAKLLRCFASLGDYWNFEFSDESKYLSVHMLSPDGLTSLHGFCEKDSSLGREVATVLTDSTAKRHVTLRLAYPPSAESDHCVKIIGLAAERWLIEPKGR